MINLKIRDTLGITGKLEINAPAKCNAFVGANRAGKSSIADAIRYALCGTVRGLARKDAPEAIFRADKLSFDGIFASRNNEALAGGKVALAVFLRGIVGKCPLRASQVGHTHAGQLNAVEFFRRKGDRDTENTAEDTVLAQDRPEWLALAK